MYRLFLALVMAFRSISTNNAPATNLVVTPPSGIVDGDILVAWSVNDAASGATTWPSGFVEGPASPQIISSFDTETVRYALKIASGESGNYTITGATAIIGGVAAFSGRVQSTTPHRDSGAKSDAGNASPYTITSAAFTSATTAPADIIWLATADGVASDQTFTAPSGYTKDADVAEASPFNRQFAFCHKDAVAAGETGSLAGSGSGASAAWTVFAIALAAPATCALTGTATASITEADIVAGGKTIIATLTNDTYVPATITPEVSYVGGQVGGRAGSTSTSSVNFALSGGTDATPQAGDLVVITVVVGSQARNPACAISGYTALGLLNSAAATQDTSLDVSRKFMGGTPDTSFTLPSTGNIADAQRYTVQVFRNVNPTTPLDVAVVSATGSGTGRPNPGSITPATSGAYVLICAGGGAGTGANYTAPANYTTNFLTGFTADTNDAMVGSGYRAWTSGAEDPAVYTGGTTNATDSWCAYTIALRPAPATTPFADAVAAFIAGLDSAQSEATGWDAVVKAGLTSANVARTSDTVATVTLPAFGTYNITAPETITDTVPGSILTGGNAIVATPTFTIDPAGGPTPITFNATPVTRSWSLPAAVVLAAASLTATPATRSWTVPTISIAAARSIAATPSTRSWSVPNALLAAGGVTLGATPVSRTWNVPITALSAARSIAATPSVQTWTVPASTLFVSGGSITFNASAVSRSWSVPTVTLAADRTFAATPAIHTWTNPSSTIATARTLVAPAAFKAWIVPTPALLVEPPIAFDATPAVSTWVVPGGTVSGITVTFTFRITGGPVMTAAIDGGRVLAASVAGGPVLMGSMSGGPV